MFTASNGHKCFIVAIEGPDRVGKATQAALLEKALTKGEHKATVETVPYDDGITYKQIYAMLHSGAVDKHPVIFQTFQAINRRIFQKQFLPTLAIHYDVLILDRWTLSTQVYGEASGVSKDATDLILRDIVEPDFTFVFDGNPFPKEGLDVWEANLPFQNRVRKLYLEYCVKDPEHFVKIDAERSKKVIHQELLAQVHNRLR